MHAKPHPTRPKTRTKFYRLALKTIQGSAFLVLVGVSLVPTATAIPDVAMKTGDFAVAQTRIYDATNGQLLMSTDSADARILEASQNAANGLFALPMVYGPWWHSFDESGSPRSWGGIEVDTTPLEGKTVGDTVSLPVSGRYTGYDDSMSLERLRGPFDRTLTIKTAEFASHVTESVTGPLLVGGILPATIVGTDGAATTLRVDVEEGDRFDLDSTGFVAEVVNSGQSSFSLLLDSPPGHAFTIPMPCVKGKDVLPVGSYRVDGVGEDVIELAYSTLNFPQLMERDLTVRVEIKQIIPAAAAPIWVQTAAASGQRLEPASVEIRPLEVEVPNLLRELGGFVVNGSCTATGANGSCTANCDDDETAVCYVVDGDPVCKCEPDAGGVLVTDTLMSGRLVPMVSNAALAGIVGLALVGTTALVGAFRGRHGE